MHNWIENRNNQQFNENQTIDWKYWVIEWKYKMIE